MADITRYALGFAFSSDLSKVVLIRKNRPEWQKGLLNGVGGRIKEGEHPMAAMKREFAEEAGVVTTHEHWEQKGIYSGPGYELHVFSLANDFVVGNVTTKTDEQIMVIPYPHVIHEHSDQLEKSLLWLLPLCLDKAVDEFIIMQESEVCR